MSVRLRPPAPKAPDNSGAIFLPNHMFVKSLNVAKATLGVLDYCCCVVETVRNQLVNESAGTNPDTAGVPRVFSITVFPTPPYVEAKFKCFKSGSLHSFFIAALGFIVCVRAKSKSFRCGARYLGWGSWVVGECAAHWRKRTCAGAA